MKTRAHSGCLYAQVFSFVLLVLLLLTATNVASAEPATHAGRSNSATKPVDIVRDPTDVPPPITRRIPALVKVTLTAREVVGTLDPASGTTYRYWTFNGKVPGPMIRVREGDTVELTLRNDGTSHMAHSIDLHAALGPGGGAAFTQAVPGQSKTFTFQATTPGLFVYHCGTPMIAEHMANGMYGLILVEPEGGLPAVEHEYYVMQGEIYTAAPKGKEGLQQFSTAKLMAETPEYFVFNGAVDALIAEHPMKANVGETVRVFFGNAGPNQTAATHAVGEIFTKVYEDGSLTTPPLTNVQTVAVPPGSAALLEFAAKMPGKFALMDHSIARMAKGLMALIQVDGHDDGIFMHPSVATAEEIAKSSAGSVSGLTKADEAQALEPLAAATAGGAADAMGSMDRASMIHMGMSDTADNSHPNGMNMGGMSGAMHMGRTGHIREHSRSARTSLNSTEEEEPNATASKAAALNGCLTLAGDGKVLLKQFQSAKIYRLEAQPLLFSQNANRFVHVTGYFGSVVATEDPGVPSFVVSTIDQIAPNCAAKISAAQIQRVLAKRTEASRGLVGMSDMGFLPKTLVINAGEKVVWRNTAEVTHNVIADPGKAVFAIDVKLPSGVQPFGSGDLAPGQSYTHTFNVTGVYQYVCTLHETTGMKGVIIVRGPQLLRASK